MAAPLTMLLRKNCAWHWDPEQQKASEQLSQCLTTASVLAHLDNNGKLASPLYRQILRQLTSQQFCQHNKEGWEHVVAYASRRTTATASNYSSYEVDLLAVLFAVEKLRSHLHGACCDLVVKNTPLL